MCPPWWEQVGTGRARTKGWSMVGLQMRHLASNVGCSEGYTVISLATTTHKRASFFLRPPIVWLWFKLNTTSVLMYVLILPFITDACTRSEIDNHLLGKGYVMTDELLAKGRVLKIGEERGDPSVAITGVRHKVVALQHEAENL